MKSPYKNLYIGFENYSINFMLRLHIIVKSIKSRQNVTSQNDLSWIYIFFVFRALRHIWINRRIRFKQPKVR
ncbi:Uncharacterised protein [Legionella busanensis]|uniref:Uncharacterized protein n=1 Tax=Legionella busanensis TaxID=190655 RepID=A0A378KHW2_9GAMM|nr:Uncharacterised protein [Legionella busanensis]